MQIVIVAFGIASATASLVSAWFWYRSAQVRIVPLWIRLGQIEPVDGSSQMHRTVAQMEAANEVAGFNRIAAIWMVPAALCAGASALTGMFV